MPAANYRLEFHGHVLEGTRTPAGWVFRCDSFPGVARKHRHAAGTDDAEGDFLWRAVLVPVVHRPRAAKEA